MNCDVEMLVAGYVLGVLEPADRDLVRDHLPTCAGCRAALAEIAPLPAMLARVSPEDAAADLPVPGDAMLGRLLAAAGETKRARRRHWYAAAAAVAVLAIGGTATGLALSHGGDDDRLRMTAAQSGISATLDVRPAASGTEFGLELAGVAPNEHCRLVAVAADGHREIAASWTATYRGTAKFDGSTALPAGQISRLVVETEDGRELASVNL
jgi:hypothetical protein